MKRMLGSWRATLAVAGIWVATLFVLGFLYRVGEITGCMLPLEAQDERCKPEVEQRSTLWSYDGVQFYDKVGRVDGACVLEMCCVSVVLEV